MSFYEKHGRYILMALNILFMVGAVICFVIGIWLCAEVSGLIGGGLIVAGVISFLLYFLGYQGAYKRDATKLKCYAWILVVVAVLGTISAIVNITTADSTAAHMNPDGARFIQQMNYTSFVNVVFLILCSVLAFGLSSDITKKSNLPSVYSNM